LNPYAKKKAKEGHCSLFFVEERNKNAAAHCFFVDANSDGRGQVFSRKSENSFTRVGAGSVFIYWGWCALDVDSARLASGNQTGVRAVIDPRGLLFMELLPSPLHGRPGGVGEKWCNPRIANGFPGPRGARYLPPIR
jgi:hypothetical protein